MFVVVLLITTAWAQSANPPPNVIGTVGGYGRENGRGAMVNRELANQLYQSSLANERAAWSGVIPNVGLLSKALQQSKDAKAADDQAKEFARAALHASNSGAHSGEFVNSRYGMANESKLKELSTTSSPYMPQVEKSLGSYGMKLSADKMSLNTPFGKFGLNDPNESWIARAVSAFKKLGLPTKGLEKGQADAIRERDALVKKIEAAVDQQIAAETQAGEAGPNDRQPAGLQPAAVADKAIGAEAGSEAVKNFEANLQQGPNGTDWNAAEKALLANRKAMGREIGLESATDPLGRKTQDIFRMIHLRYQSLYSEGAFLSK